MIRRSKPNRNRGSEPARHVVHVSAHFDGAGLGASHQTGWTRLVAKLIELYGILDPERALDVGKGNSE